MQMQTNVSVVTPPVKQYKLGDTVTWKSHAAGVATTKIGKVVAIVDPNISHFDASKGKMFSKKFLVDTLRQTREITREDARIYVDRTKYYNWRVQLIEAKYKMKFNFGEGFYRRNVFSYIIEVDRGETLKPLLYHPKTKNLKPAV